MSETYLAGFEDVEEGESSYLLQDGERFTLRTCSDICELSKESVIAPGYKAITRAFTDLALICFAKTLEAILTGEGPKLTEPRIVEFNQSLARAGIQKMLVSSEDFGRLCLVKDMPYAIAEIPEELVSRALSFWGIDIYQDEKVDCWDY